MTGLTLANPVLDHVASGNVSIQQAPNSTVINQGSAKAIINWQSFNINAAEKTHFQQPTGGVALNRINPQMGASQIYGHLSATGKIILVNQAGIFFGPGSQVDVGGIIASTHDISDADFLADRYHFNKTSSDYNGSIINQGTIHAAENGLVALVGNAVRNDGTIEVHSGKIILASGNKFTFDFSGDQLINFTVDEEADSTAVDHQGNKITDAVKNTGQLLADGGTIIVTAKAAREVVDHVVNMEGVAIARSVSQDKNGVIILDAGEGDIAVAGKLDASGKEKNETGGQVKILAKKITVKSTAEIDVSGDQGGGKVLIGGNYQGKGPEKNAYSTTVDKGAKINADAITSGNGGTIIAWSDHDTQFSGSISARGGAESGDGGFVETSGHYLNVTDIDVNLLSAHGKTGTWLLDPTDLTISAAANSNVTGASPYTGDANATSSNLNVTTLTSALNGANVTVLTTAGGTGLGTGDIIVGTPISWTSATTLTLSAYKGIQLNNNISSTAAANVILQADNTGTGTGTISGSGVVNTAAGGTATFYYNPSSYATPTDFSANVTGATLTAYMLINSAQQLQDMNTNLSGTYALSKNIDASVTSGWNGGTGFIPVGTSSSAFTGNFNGQNYTIDSLYMNTSSIGYAGLFGNAGTGSSLNNVGLTNVNIQSGGTQDNALGGLVGKMSGGSINHVYVTGVVSQVAGAGCGVGCAVGGVVGSLLNSSITGSYNAAAVTSTTPFSTGGLVGGTNAGTTINASYNSGTVTGHTVGGLVGGFSFSTITNSYSTGAVIASGGAGSLVSGGDNGTIINSYATGSVSGTGTFGGLVQFANGYTITNSFWDTQTTGQAASSGSTGSAGYRGMTTAQMQVLSNFQTGSPFISGAGWNITSTPSTTSTPANTVWFMANGTRPMLMSELFPVASTGFPTGSGPYDIRTAHQLQLMSSTLGASYVLASDIGLSTSLANSADVWGASSAGFAPIGTGHVSGSSFINDTPFTGSFNGQYHLISGLAISRENSGTANSSAVGLLGAISGSTIQNVGLVDVNVSGGANVGGLIGHGDGNSTVTNSFVTGSVTGNRPSADLNNGVGGLVGNFVANAGSAISNSFSLASVTSTDNIVGGLVGSLNVSNVNGVTNSFSAGYVNTASGLSSGGLYFSGATASNSFWDRATSGQSTSSGGSIGCYGNTSCAPGAVNLTLQATFTGWDFSNTWGIIQGTSYPYLKGFYPTTPRVIQGSLISAGGGGKSVSIASNAAAADTTYTGANNTFYSLTANGAIANNSNLLIYGQNGVGNILALAPAAGASLISLSTSAVNNIQIDSSITSTSNSLLISNFKGSLTSNDILFALSSGNFALGNGTNTTANLVSSGSTTYTIDTPITIGGSTSRVTLAGPVVFNVTGSNTVTTSGTQSYGSSTLSKNTTLSGAGISFNSSITGGAHSLTLSDSGTSVLGGAITGLTTLQTNAVTLNNGNVTSTGTQSYGAATLGAATVLTGSGITLSSVTGAGNSLVLADSGTSVLNGALSGLSTLQANAVNLNANVTTTGNQTYTGNLSVTNNPVLTANNVQVTGNILGNNATNFSINQSGNNGFLTGTFSNVNNINFGGTGTFSLNNSSALTGFAGGVSVSSGGTLSINNLTTTAALTLNGGNLLSTGTSLLNSTVTLTASNSIATSLLADILTITGAINGSGALSLLGPGSILLNGNVGNSTALGSLSSSAGTLTVGGSQVHTVSNQTYGSALVLGADVALLSDSGDIAFQGGVTGGNHNLNITGTQLSLSSNTLSGFDNLIVTGLGGNNVLTVLTGDSQQWTINGANQGAINNISGVNSFQFNNIQNLVGGSGNNNFILNGGTVSGSIVGGSGSSNTLTVASGDASWTVSGTNTGSVTGVTGGFSNIQNLTGGTGINTFFFTGTGSINGQIDGGNITNINSINFSGYSGPISLTLALPSGNELNTGSVNNSSAVRIASFTQIQQAIGSSTGLDTLTLPNKSNLTITYTNAAHTAGYISDPFYFSNITVSNPPPEPTPEPTPIPPVVNADIAQIVTPFQQSNTTNNNATGTFLPVIFVEGIIIDQNITEIVGQEISLDDELAKKQKFGC